MDILQEGNNVIIKGTKDFDILQTLECGQCFHFDSVGENEYGIVYKENLLHIKREGENHICYNISQKNFEEIWSNFFDLNTDYKKIKDYLLNKDNRLKSAIKKNYGVRILNQDFCEMIMSFIISQNKQIPHIKKIVKDISKKYGKFLGEINNVEFYSFPDEDRLAKIKLEDYKECKTGFRAPYLYNAAMHLQNREIYNYEYLSNLSYEEAKDTLKQIKGVGDKIANCVLLFSLGFKNAFPVDVWIKRIMEEMYFHGETKNEVIMSYAKNLFGEYGGYAQQYLFYYARENSK